MPKLSQGQIAAYAQSAGLSGGAAQIASAVAMAESGGNTRAHNPIPPDNSYGLWQINMLGSLGPDRRKKLGISSNSQLFDPGVNARAMAMISSNGSDWQPWSTYTNGAYKKYMDGADQAGFMGDLGEGLGDLFGGGAGMVVPGLEGLTSIAELAVGAGRWIANPDNWIRVGQVWIGVLLIGVGVNLAVRKKVAPLVNQAADVIPGGKAMKKATYSAAKPKPKPAPKAPAKKAPAKKAAAAPEVAQ